MSGETSTLSHFPVRISAWTPPLFFDAAAGLPPSPATVQWLEAALANAWANPIGRHGPAARSRAALERAQAQFSTVLGCRPEEIWFAPSADFALQFALRSVLGPSSSCLISAVERLILLRTTDALAHTGVEVSEAPVKQTGQLDRTHSAPSVDWAIVQAANRETGVTQNLAAIRAWLNPTTQLFVDATAIRSPRDLPADWDVVVLDPLQWGGPPGVSVVGCRDGVRWVSTWPLENEPGARLPGAPSAALAAAAVMSWPDTAEAAAEEARLAQITEHLSQWLRQEVTGVDLLGQADQRLGHVLSASFLYVNAELLVDDLARRGFSVHSGSACTSDTRRPSHVLQAMGALTSGNLRLSLPPGCPSESIEDLLAALAELVAEQRAGVGL